MRPFTKCGAIVGGGRDSPLGLCRRDVTCVTFTARDAHAYCVQHAGMIGGKTISFRFPAPLLSGLAPAEIQELALGSLAGETRKDGGR